ncbi:MAG: hypothetical protein CFH22_00623 [Alphaproteobacteria bacterium MarineAlpha5_Bin12]|nr:MAG: hypothetical protein CFH22_00623 [Alphaproteobacteria bacterium MarineAlpha5_Bin12]|tara:strand:- start:40983 stop:41303 length:321 start_codon:yes stop_codon:yes gene_type:complete
MNRSINFKKRLYNFLFLLFSFFVFFYLIYILFLSERGIINLFTLQNELIINTKLYDEITQNNNDLIKKIDKLKIENLDLDYLEELNIKKNGIVNKNDILIVNSNNN